MRGGTYPLAPLLASLVVGYACAYEEGGTVMGFAKGNSERVFGVLWRDPFVQSHQNSEGDKVGKGAGGIGLVKRTGTGACPYG